MRVGLPRRLKPNPRDSMTWIFKFLSQDGFIRGGVTFQSESVDIMSQRNWERRIQLRQKKKRNWSWTRWVLRAQGCLEGGSLFAIQSCLATEQTRSIIQYWLKFLTFVDSFFNVKRTFKLKEVRPIDQKQTSAELERCLSELVVNNKDLATPHDCCGVRQQQSTIDTRAQPLSNRLSFSPKNKNKRRASSRSLEETTSVII